MPFRLFGLLSFTFSPFLFSLLFTFDSFLFSLSFTFCSFLFPLLFKLFKTSFYVLPGLLFFC
ncbi:hypothetical protein Hanom_Chr16g01430161 [Helianthus anomalus]